MDKTDTTTDADDIAKVDEVLEPDAIDTDVVEPNAFAGGELNDIRSAIRQHGPSVVTAICLAAFAVAAIVVYRVKKEQGVSTASQILTTARSPQELETLLGRYSSTPSAPFALLKLAKMYFSSENYDMALTKYTQFQEQFPEHQMLKVAELGQIHCIEAKRQWEEALKGFTSFAESNPDHFLTAQAVMGKARCLRVLGKTEAARITYEDFIAGSPESMWLAVAESELADINRARELADQKRQATSQ